MDRLDLKILLADDDQDDYLITRDLLLGIEWGHISLDWAPTYQSALAAIEQAPHDLYFFDYQMGEGDGLGLLSRVLACGYTAPVILLTGLDDWETDTRAIQAGAADYLVKSQLDPKHLERSIRHAMERKRAKEELAEYAMEIEMRRAQEQLKDAEHLAHTDALTGLGNRRRAEAAMRGPTRAQDRFSLLVFDLDGFKAINDCHGHNQGDQLLKLVGQRIRGAVRESDVVCRWGGDEFVVILPDTALADAQARALQIQASAFGELILTHAGGDIAVNVTAGAGAAEYRPGESAAEFFERADQLLLAEKRRRHHRQSPPHRSQPVSRA